MEGKSNKLVDLFAFAIYYLSMDNSRNQYLEEITSLEDTINSAIELINRYENENTALKNKMESLTLEKSLLLQKNDQAKNRLESMISRLKSLEQQSA